MSSCESVIQGSQCQRNSGEYAECGSSMRGVRGNQRKRNSGEYIEERGDLDALGVRQQRQGVNEVCGCGGDEGRTGTARTCGVVCLPLLDSTIGRPRGITPSPHTVALVSLIYT
jgi:hypothetical protein